MTRPRRAAFRGSEYGRLGAMNPLDSITGTIVTGVVLALILAAIF